jgi:hypothetical protein
LTAENKLTNDQNLIKEWIEKQKKDYGINFLEDTTRRYWPNIQYTKSNKWEIDGNTY